MKDFKAGRYINQGTYSLGILKETTGAKRGKLYLFKEYSDLFQ